MDITDYLTLSQAAEALGYRESSYLRRLCNEGRIPNTQKRGKTWYIPRAWVLSEKEKLPTGQGARGQQRS